MNILPYHPRLHETLWKSLLMLFGKDKWYTKFEREEETSEMKSGTDDNTT